MQKITFFINENKIKKNYKSYNNNNIHYTLKTNSNKRIIKILNKISNEKISFSISTLEHLKILKKMNIDSARICSINTFLDNKDIKKMYSEGVRSFTFSNLTDIKKFEKYASTKDVSINIRISISSFIEDKSYIGTNIYEYKEIFNYINGKYKKIGISFYLPQTTKDNINKINLILNELKKYPKDYIVIGGIPNAEKTKKIITDQNIQLEIGQNLLYKAIDLKMNIIKKENNNFILSNGIYGGFLDVILYNKKFELYIKNNNKKVMLQNKPNIDLEELNFYGPSCDTLDYIGTYYVSKDMLNIMNEKKTYLC